MQLFPPALTWRSPVPLQLCHSHQWYSVHGTFFRFAACHSQSQLTMWCSALTVLREGSWRVQGAFLQLAALLVMHLFIYYIHLLVVPALAVTTKSLEDLSEAVTELCRLADSLLNFTVILIFSVIEIWPVDIHQFARPRDAYVIFLYDLIGQLLLNLGL